jgi:hypothetical protein
MPRGGWDFGRIEAPERSSTGRGGNECGGCAGVGRWRCGCWPSHLPRLFSRRQIDKNGTGSHQAAIRPPTKAAAALREKHLGRSFLLNSQRRLLPSFHHSTGWRSRAAIAGALTAGREPFAIPSRTAAPASRFDNNISAASSPSSSPPSENTRASSDYPLITCTVSGRTKRWGGMNPRGVSGGAHPHVLYRRSTSNGYR